MCDYIIILSESNLFYQVTIPQRPKFKIHTQHNYPTKRDTVR